VTDEVHDVVVDLESLLVAEMGGGVHAGAEVRGAELAAELDFATDGETGVGTVAEVQVSLTTESELGGEGANTTGDVEAGSDFSVTGAGTGGDTATEGTDFGTNVKTGTDVLRAGEGAGGSDGGSSEVESTMHVVCMG